MEPQQHPNEDNSGSGKGGFLCSRQSSTRWTPTTDQIRILKELYYNNGVRSPSADQIQRISARLRQYGKIEGKNVFYWFQNHKARERQKKRFTTPDHLLPMQQRPNNTVASGGGNWKSDANSQLHNNNNYPNINHGYASSTGVFNVGQNQDCSISASGSCTGAGGATESLSHNFGWVGNIDPAAAYSSSYAFFDKKKFIDGILEEEQEDDYDYEAAASATVHVAPHIETLPLFPMHGEDINVFCSNLKPELNSYYSGWYRNDDAYNCNASRTASLELSLNSYTGRSQDFI